MVDPRGEVTQLLEKIESGDDSARTRLLEVAYEELRSMAGQLMKRERADHTLQPTALLNEAALRLLNENALSRMANRSYFFGTMANAMRRVLVDHARARSVAKRGGGEAKVPLDIAIDILEQTHKFDLQEMDEALSELEKLDPRQAEIITLRFFGGFEMQAIADQLDVSLSTVEKDWRFARAWLRKQLREEE